MRGACKPFFRSECARGSGQTRLLGGTGVQRRDKGRRHVIALTKTALSPQLGVPCGFQNEQAWCLFMEAPCWSRGQ